MIGKEIWKDIKGYEGLYQVSTLGRVRSLNYRRKKKIALLVPRKKWNGYMEVYLFKDGWKKHYQIHRLVAEAFIVNSLNYPQINHKNEIKFDNRIGNLEWCSNEYNAKYKREDI